jgi:hypothetical protein
MKNYSTRKRKRNGEDQDYRPKKYRRTGGKTKNLINQRKENPERVNRWEYFM